MKHVVNLSRRIFSASPTPPSAKEPEKAPEDDEEVQSDEQSLEESGEKAAEEEPRLDKENWW